ncbi:MAG: hypothetical protein ACO3UM_04535, partial [Planctomycetota bacterium]
GPTTVAAGVLTVDHPSALASSMVTVEAGATLRTGPGVTLRTPSVTVSGGTLDTSALTVDALAGIVSLTINGGSLASSPSLAIGLLGFSTALWGSLPLPAALDGLGMTGCSLLVAADLPFPLVADPRGNASWTLPIPADRTLLGQHFHQQAVALDPTANAFGATLSNAGTGRVGRQ